MNLQTLQNLTLNSIFWIVLGIGFIIGGCCVGYSWRMYPFAAGLIFLGIGGVLCGVTNGFTDYSPMGRLSWKFGILLLGVGALLSAYGVLKFI